MAATEQPKSVKSKKDKSTGEAVKRKKGKSSKKHGHDASQGATDSGLKALLADEKSVDLKLSSLFAAKPELPRSAAAKSASKSNQTAIVDHITDSARDDKDDTAPVVPSQAKSANNVDQDLGSEAPARKRKRRDREDDLEDSYMRKVARQDEKDLERLRKDKAQQAKTIKELDDGSDDEQDEQDEDNGVNDADVLVDASSDGDTDGDAAGREPDDDWKPPQHESITAASLDVDKAGRTIFISNVSIRAVTDKSARKTLERHLVSFFADAAKSDDQTPHKLESLRFRSTPYDPKLPKKAAYALGEVMTTTMQSTNAYAVYSTPALARTACRKLNGSVVLERHIRVDSVAHPAPIAHKRCVFVGNLGFVDDESNIIAANEAEGREKRKQNQKPSDVEEGLWRLFAKHGTVESVRVVRDKGTRVGKGIAYVQFTDENAVEGALSEDGKKDPPRLPRKLRVARAKAMKRSKAPQRPTGKPEQAQGYQRKVTPGEATLRGRVGKLMGKAAAAMATPDFKRPESFIFEGHRASSAQKNTGLKLGKSGKRKAKPTGRSAKRAAAYKSGAVKKKAAS